MSEDLNLIAKIILDKTGLVFSEDKLQIFQSKINKRVKELNLFTYNEYLNYLILYDKNNTEIISLVNSLTVNETFFFRHPQQFDAIKNQIIPNICSYNSSLKKPFTTFRIWSAGCANGCETYTLAILISEFELLLKANYFEKIEIIGTDIDTQTLEIAERGVYSNRCVKTAMPENYLNNYFEVTEEGYKVKDQIKKMVVFKKLNLIKDIYPNEVDIIFCRNVLYYFDNKSQRYVIKTFYNSLKNNGYLFLGGTESLSLGEYFDTCYYNENFYYKKWSTDRRYYIDDAKHKFTRKAAKDWPAPEITIDKNNSVLYFKGVFAENSDINKLKQEIIYSYSLFDKDKDEEPTILKISYHIIYFDFSEIRWITNFLLAEIKDIIIFLKSKNVKVVVITGDNADIMCWVDKANFKDVCTIERHIDFSIKNSFVSSNNASKESKSDKTYLRDSSEENKPKKKSELLKTSQYQNKQINKISLKKEVKLSGAVQEENKENIFYITQCSDKELENLKKEIAAALKNKIKLIIDVRKANRLSNEFFQILSKALKATEDKEFIHLRE